MQELLRGTIWTVILISIVLIGGMIEVAFLGVM